MSPEKYLEGLAQFPNVLELRRDNFKYMPFVPTEVACLPDHATVTEGQFREWAVENVIGRYSLLIPSLTLTVAFELAEDAVKYKLVWT